MASKFYYEEEVCHDGLNKYKIVKAETEYELNQKVKALKAQWDEQWEKKVEKERKIRNTENAVKHAEELTDEALALHDDLDRLLSKSLSPIYIDYEELKDKSKYKGKKPLNPYLRSFPIEPHREDAEFNPKPSFFTRLSKQKMEAFNETNTKRFEDAHVEWEKEIEIIKSENEAKNKEYDNKMAEWKNEADKFYEKQKKENEKINKFKEDFELGEKAAVERYFDLLFTKISLPFDFDSVVDLEYNPENKGLIVDLLLPDITDIPTLKSVSYVKSKNEFKESHFSEAQIKKKYDNLIYQIV